MTFCRVFIDPDGDLHVIVIRQACAWVPDPPKSEGWMSCVGTWMRRGGTWACMDACDDLDLAMRAALWLARHTLAVPA